MITGIAGGATIVSIGGIDTLVQSEALCRVIDIFFDERRLEAASRI